MAGSGLRPLSKIPHCCLPQESGPCLSPSVADHPLKPAMDRSHGRPLPHHQANPTQPHPIAINLSPKGRIRYYTTFPWAIPYYWAGCYALLTRLPLSTHKSELLVRLACVKPAASVRSEPESNSQIENKISRLCNWHDGHNDRLHVAFKNCRDPSRPKPQAIS